MVSGVIQMLISITHKSWENQLYQHLQLCWLILVPRPLRQCSLNCSRWERVQVNVQHLNTGLNQLGKHTPTEQHAGLDQHAVLLGCERPVTYQGDILNCWENPQIEELDWHLQVQIPCTKLHSVHTIHFESSVVNPHLFFHLFSYSECCAFRFALSVCVEWK